MNDGAPVSMIESRTHKDHPRKHGRKIFFVFVAVFAILVIGLLVATYLSSNTSTKQEVALDDDSDDTEVIVAEIVIDNTDFGENIWKVASGAESGSIKRSDCESLIKYGNQFAEAFGGAKINTNVCQERFLKVSGKQVSSTEYPYEDLMVIYMQAGNQCLVAPFYEGFYGLQNYKVTDGNCAEPLKSIGVVND